MASSSASITAISASSCGKTRGLCHHVTASMPLNCRARKLGKISVKSRICSVLSDQKALQYRKLGDSDLNISEITFGTMTFGEQNTEKEAHDMLSYAFERGINFVDTAEAYPLPMKKETQGKTDLYIGSWLKSRSRDKVVIATKVCGYSEQLSYLRENAKVLRVDAANIRESVEKSLKRLGTDYIDLLQIHWPDRYVPLYGEFSYDASKWRPSLPFVEQLRAFQELINEGKVRHIGVSNETSYGVMDFVHAAKFEGLPNIISIQHSYSLLVRCRFEVDLVEVCHPKNCNIGLLAYSPLGGGSLSGKYVDIDFEAAKRGRLDLYSGYMERYNQSLARADFDAVAQLRDKALPHGFMLQNKTRLSSRTFQEATAKYVELAKRYGLTPVELALGFVRDRPFVTSTIIGATSIDQLKEDIDVFTRTERPLLPQVMADMEAIYKRYKDPPL